MQDAASRTNAVGGRALGAFYGAAALVLSAPLLLPGWSTVDRSLLAGLVVAAALVSAIVLVVDHDPSPRLTHLLTGLATLIIGSALLAGGGGAASATISVLFVWVVVHAVVNLSRRGAAVQVGLAALTQAACLVAVGEGVQAAAEVTVTLAVAVSTAVCVAVLLHRAREAAGLDDLTGLLNRRGLERALDTALALARRTGDRTSVLVLDLDGFKAINDSHGHAAGDRALIAVACAWSRELRTGDALARVGGDEFVAVLSDTDESVAREVARRLAASTPKSVGVSIGVATARAGAGGTTLLTSADDAMYRQKRDRRSLSRMLPTQPGPAAAAPVRNGTAIVAPRPPAAPQPGHDVHFFGADEGLVPLLATYVGDGLAAGEVCVTVATPDHRVALRRVLGPAAALAERTGQLIQLDAAETLPKLLRDGRPDPGLFDDVVGTLMDGCLSTGRNVRAYGEMVGLLWIRGDVAEALALEDMWNGLRDRHCFRLLCGYPVADPEALGAGYGQICARHHATSRAG